VTHLVYLLILLACVLGTLPLEFVLRTRVYGRWRRLLCALVPVLVAFGGWDGYAAAHHWWRYDSRYVIGIDIGRLPIEELLFFVVVPTCAVLTLEAVRVRRPDWLIGDEAHPGSES
jgi:lycopene cyclase domain-containing protein